MTIEKLRKNIDGLAAQADLSVCEYLDKLVKEKFDAKDFYEYFFERFTKIRYETEVLDMVFRIYNEDFLS